MVRGDFREAGSGHAPGLQGKGNGCEVLAGRHDLEPPVKKVVASRAGGAWLWRGGARGGDLAGRR